MTPTIFKSSRDILIEKLFGILTHTDKSRDVLVRRMHIREYGSLYNSPLMGALMLPDQLNRILFADDYKDLSEEALDKSMMYVRTKYCKHPYKYQYVGTYFMSLLIQGIIKNNILTHQTKEAYLNVHKSVLNQILTDDTINGCYVVIDGLNDRAFHEWRFTQSEESPVNRKFLLWQMANEFLRDKSTLDIINATYGTTETVKRHLKHGTGPIFILERNEAKQLLRYTMGHLHLPSGKNTVSMMRHFGEWFIEDRMTPDIRFPMHGQPSKTEIDFRKYNYYKYGDQKFKYSHETVTDESGKETTYVVYTPIRDIGIPDPENTVCGWVDGEWKSTGTLERFLKENGCD